MEAAAVVGTGLAHDEAVTLEPIDEPRDAALTEQHRGRQLAHPQPMVRRVVQMHQNLELREREAVLALELPVELTHERGVHAQKSPPRGELEIGQLMVRRGAHCRNHWFCNQTNHTREVVGMTPSGQIRPTPRTGAPTMQLEGIHHVTCITGDAPGNVVFYTGVLGLRLVKKTVNQDDPRVYHLFYADEEGSAGADITFFEYPGARRGRPGDGMIHTVTFRVADEDALAFWETRLGEHGVRTAREPGRLRFDDPEGLGLELVVSDAPDEPLIARHPEIPADVALQGFDGVRSFAPAPERSRRLLEEVMGFRSVGDATWELRGAERGGLYAYDAPPASGAGIPGAGTVHHVAWASTMEDHAA